MSADPHAILDDIGRVGLTHALDPAPLAAGLGIETRRVERLIATGAMSGPMQALDAEAATYVLNILVRLETRCRGDSTAIRIAMIRPCPALGGRSVTEALLARPDIEGLAAIRAGVATLEVPRVKMWRVADGYS